MLRPMTIHLTISRTQMKYDALPLLVEVPMDSEGIRKLSFQNLNLNIGRFAGGGGGGGSGILFRVTDP